MALSYRSYGTDNFIATVLCILQHPSLSSWSSHPVRLGWVCYYQEEFEFGHSSYAVKDSVDYYKGWKT